MEKLWKHNTSFHDFLCLCSVCKTYIESIHQVKCIDQCFNHLVRLKSKNTFLKIKCFEDSCYLPILCFAIVEGRLNFGSAMNDISRVAAAAPSYQLPIISTHLFLFSIEHVLTNELYLHFVAIFTRD